MSPPPAVALAAPSSAMSLATLRGRGVAVDTGLHPEALAVHTALLARGLETPMVDSDLSRPETRKEFLIGLDC